MKYRSLIARLLKRSHGSALLENVLALALVAGGLFVACNAISSSTTASIKADSRLTRSTPSTAAPAVVPDVLPIHEWRFDCPDCVPTYVRAMLRYQNHAMVFVVAIGVCIWVRIRNQRVALEISRRVQSATDPSARAPLPQALFTKRQQLLRVLDGNLSAVLEGGLRVVNVMSTRPTCVTTGTSVDRVKDLLESRRIRHLLVLGPDDRLAGIISDRDVKSRIGETAGEIMSPGPARVQQDSCVNTAISLMINMGVSALPVVQEDRICGILTSTDAMLTLQCALHLLEKIGHELSHAPQTEGHASERKPAGMVTNVPLSSETSLPTAVPTQTI